MGELALERARLLAFAAPWWLFTFEPARRRQAAPLTTMTVSGTLPPGAARPLPHE
jgi:hypothetical protein